MVDKEKQERFAMTNAFPWDNPGKDDLEELQAALKKAGKEVTLQELQEMQRKVIRETAGLPNDEEIEYSSNPQEGA
jgi:MFS superfamily sulfate permease-like transporter